MTKMKVSVRVALAGEKCWSCGVPFNMDEQAHLWIDSDGSSDSHHQGCLDARLQYYNAATECVKERPSIDAYDMGLCADKKLEEPKP